MELGTQIRKYRNERTLSQEALAEKVYVSRQTVSNWENDKSYMQGLPSGSSFWEQEVMRRCL